MPDFSQDFSDYFNSDFFKVKGPQVFTIKSIGYEKIGPENRREEKLILRFNEDDRGCTLNRTRYDVCSGIFGSPDTDKWIGGRVELYFDPTINRPAGGKGGIGIREPRGVRG